MSQVSDTHGLVNSRLKNIDPQVYIPEETAVIILGDMGLNFYLNEIDAKNKKAVNDTGFHIYAVRGNHEERPENISTMEQWYDEDVDGTVWREVNFPNIRYFMDGHAYLIDGHPTLVIGGAYSVDKWYRLNRATPGASWTGWFKDEQLTPEEMQDIETRMSGHHFDFILTHTCPYGWQPTDLFLNGLDQSTVDNTMEHWFDTIKDKFNWNIWLFGHFHDDRLVRPHVEMYYTDIEDLDTIWNRWNNEMTIQNEWWLKKSPNYYFDDNIWAKKR